jgi:hypothetical protein
MAPRHPEGRTVIYARKQPEGGVRLRQTERDVGPSTHSRTNSVARGATRLPDAPRDAARVFVDHQCDFPATAPGPNEKPGL